MSNSSNCRFSGCSQPGTVLMENRPLCVAHFVSIGYERLDEYDRAVTEHKFHEGSAEAVWVFLLECIERAADLTQSAEQIDNLQRARLLDILLRAAELSRHLRRSARKTMTISVRIRCEKLGRFWEEDTQTRVLSRHGVMLDCTHSAEPGDKLTIKRLDTSDEVEGRVAWRRPGSEGRFSLGIEFLHAENFWALKWESPDDSMDVRDWNCKPA